MFNEKPASAGFLFLHPVMFASSRDLYSSLVGLNLRLQTAENSGRLAFSTLNVNLIFNLRDIWWWLS
jgi:hypothetical protein